jgi:hypothetical protein
MSGEYARLYCGPAGHATPHRACELQRPEPNPITQAISDLIRRFDPGGYRLSCPVAGCRWILDVPRMEMDPEPLDVGAGDWVVDVRGVPREDLEATLTDHLELHAQLAETGAEDAPLPLRPCSCGEAWAGHPEPHALSCAMHGGPA